MPLDLKTPVDRVLCNLDLYLVDHGFFRAMYDNFFEICPGIYRSSQPSPAHIRRYHRKYALRTIINLRGKGPRGPFLLEKEACDQLGIRLVTHTLYSRRAPAKESILAIRDLLQTLERPILVHCKAGADRAGLMSTLIALLVDRQPPEQAIQQLHWRYGHSNKSATGIIDAFFRAYIEANQKAPVDFIEWVEHHYDPVALKASFQPKAWANIITDILLRRE